jgi:hypothetical protein
MTAIIRKFLVAASAQKKPNISVSKGAKAMTKLPLVTMFNMGSISRVEKAMILFGAAVEMTTLEEEPETTPFQVEKEMIGSAVGLEMTG